MSFESPRSQEDDPQKRQSRLARFANECIVCFADGMILYAGVISDTRRHDSPPDPTQQTPNTVQPRQTYDDVQGRDWLRRYGDSQELIDVWKATAPKFIERDL